MDELAPGPFRTVDASTQGLTRHILDSPRYLAPSRGVRYAADDPDPRRAMREAAVVVSRDDAVLAGLSAAEHWGLPVPPWFGLALRPNAVVSVTPESARPQRTGVRGRRLRLPPEHLTVRSGIRITTPARTWLDCAADISLPHLVAMGDAALRTGLTTSLDLETVTRWAFRRRGVVAARTALPILDPGAESPTESIVRTLVVLDGLPRPECNVDIHHDGRWIARVDLCWRAERVIVEYDGAVHLEELQRRRDAVRRNELQAAGWRVITLTADDLRRPASMLALITRALHSRPAR